MATRKAKAVEVPRRGRKPVPTGESRHDKFLRLAADRVTNTLDQIRLIGNLSGVNYEFKVEEILKIKRTLHEAVDDEMKRFEPRLQVVLPEAELSGKPARKERQKFAW